jgi:hypothetical protein
MRRIWIVLAVLLTTASCVPGEDPRAGRPAPAAHEDPTTPPSNPPPASASPTDGLVVVWTRGGMPAGAAAQLRGVDGVEQVVTVTGGSIWGPKKASYQSFFETAYLEPGPIAQTLLGGARAAFSRTGASLLKAWVPRLGGLRIAPSVTVSDRAALGFEGISVGKAPPRWGRDFLLVRTNNRPALRTAVTALLDGSPFRIRSQEQTPLLRYADSVEPPMYFKQRFGSFSARRHGGTLEIQPAWLDRNIVEVSLPLLGEITCHRELVGPLRSAMEEIESAGLGKEIVDQSGCFSGRFIGSDPTAAVSAHAWGAAIDINASSNPQGSVPTMHPRVVEIMASNGFNWGGKWLLPDGMHFEWDRHP